MSNQVKELIQRISFAPKLQDQTSIIKVNIMRVKILHFLVLLFLSTSSYAQRNEVKDVKIYFQVEDNDTFCWDIVKYRWKDIHNLIPFDSSNVTFDEYYNEEIITSYFGNNIFQYTKPNYELLQLKIINDTSIFIEIDQGNYNIRGDVEQLQTKFNKSHQSYLKKKTQFKNATSNSIGWLSLDIQHRDYVITIYYNELNQIKEFKINYLN